MKKNATYSDVLKELEKTLESLNRGEVPIDRLESTVRSASEMIKFLKQKLHSTQAEITTILKEIEDDEGLDTADDR